MYLSTWLLQCDMLHDPSYPLTVSSDRSQWRPGRDARVNRFSENGWKLTGAHQRDGI